jgi:hypothetical protein
MTRARKGHRRFIIVLSIAAAACLAAPLGSARVLDVGGLQLPGDISVEATGPGGAVATWSPDPPLDTDPMATVGCNHSSGETFPLGTTAVTCNASNGDSGSFNVVVQDTTAPSFGSVPDVNQTTNNPGGTTVSYTAPSATDAVSGSIAGTCAPASGSHFNVGSTLVSCEAKDSSGNVGSTSFDVNLTFVDNTPPTFTKVPGSITAEATGPGGAQVNYTITATDDSGAAPTIDCQGHGPGSTFPLGQTTVSCTAKDGAGNTSAPASFTVTVVDMTKPTLSLPSDQTIQITQPGNGTFSYSATASDLVDGSVPVSCNPSGSSFPIGTTTVNCSASDSHGNSVSGSFHVTVVLVDTTPPVLSNVPGNIKVEANGPSGSVVHFANPTATDNLDGPIALVPCTPSSGATFPLGTTTVACSATDSHGNRGTASFSVDVVDTTPPQLTIPGNSTVYATTPAGINKQDDAMQLYLDGAKAHDIVDKAPTVTNNAPDFLPIGKYQITFSAHDASGNTSTGTSYVEVRPPLPAGKTPPVSPAPDRTPPDDVRNLNAVAGDGTVTLTWTKPIAADFNHVVVTRSTAEPGAKATTIYTGPKMTMVDHGLRNGVEYRYVVVAVDKAGNAAAGAVVVATPRRSALRSPRDGARLRKAPKLVWLRATRADYYNVQLFRGTTKLLSAWPLKPTLRLHAKWRYLGRGYRLTPGLYRWYVWPGFGARADIDYGEMLGSSTFRIVG